MKIALFSASACFGVSFHELVGSEFFQGVHLKFCFAALPPLEKLFEQLPQYV